MELQQTQVKKRYYTVTGKKRGVEPAVKDEESLIYQFKQGRTLASLGGDYGISRERIRQILKKHGLSGADGGSSTLSIYKKHERTEKSKIKKAISEQKCFEKYGCDLAFKDKLTDGYEYWQAPSMKYHTQKRNAIRRGIAWDLTLPQWWDIWQKSGHWHDRGFGGGKYVMARICDIGAYSIDNVKIITHNENSSEARLMDKVYDREIIKKSRKYKINGSYYTIKELSKIYKLKEGTIAARINRGLSVLDACTKPLKPWGR